MGKKEQEKIDKLYTDIWFLIKGESQMIKDQVMRGLGYCKPPKDKLSDEDCIIAFGSARIKYEFRAGTEVRRKLLLTDIAGIEREFTIIINDEEGIKTVK